MISHIFVEVLHQQNLNRDQWGGEAHDDKNRPRDWINYIDHQMNRAQAAVKDGTPEAVAVRDRLVKIAALCFDGIQSLDRNGARNGQ